MTNLVSEQFVMKQTWVERQIDIRSLLEKSSYFLMGPRQTGKTSLIRRFLTDVRFYDLLDSATYLALSRQPGRLAEEVGSSVKRVVIDEIQRLPSLLNEVHRSSKLPPTATAESSILQTLPATPRSPAPRCMNITRF